MSASAGVSRTRNGRPRRISVVGATGSGKTHLSRILAAELNLPVYELDSLRRDSAGRELAHEQFAQAVAELAARDEWIIDGHYRDVRELIWKQADTVLWLNYPFSRIFLQLVRRFSGKHATDNSQAHAGNSGRASWRRRLGRLARTLRERGEYGRVLRGPGFEAVDVVELRSPKAATEWVRRRAS